MRFVKKVVIREFYLFIYFLSSSLSKLSTFLPSFDLVFSHLLPSFVQFSLLQNHIFQELSSVSYYPHQEIFQKIKFKDFTFFSFFATFRLVDKLFIFRHQLFFIIIIHFFLFILNDFLFFFLASFTKFTFFSKIYD